MDFGDILDAWEKQCAVPQGDRKRRKARSLEKTREKDRGGSQKQDALPVPAALPGDVHSTVPGAAKTAAKKTPRDMLAEWLDTHEVTDKDAGHPDASPVKGAERARLLRKAPDARIDLHGLTQDTAWEELDAFFKECSEKKLEKVLIVHGKGNHSAGEAVLSRLTRKFIEKCPLVGESGHNPAHTGGSGATWVFLKYF